MVWPSLPLLPPMSVAMTIDRGVQSDTISITHCMLKVEGRRALLED